MSSLCRLPVAKNYNFGQILTFCGLLYRRPFTDEGHIWCAIADPRSTLKCQISSRSVYSVVLWRRKTPNFCHILPYFGLRHLVVSPIGNSRFWPPRRRVKSEPHQTWHGDRGPRARSFTSKTFRGLSISNIKSPTSRPYRTTNM